MCFQLQIIKRSWTTSSALRSVLRNHLRVARQLFEAVEAGVGGEVVAEVDGIGVGGKAGVVEPHGVPQHGERGLELAHLRLNGDEIIPHLRILGNEFGITEEAAIEMEQLKGRIDCNF